MLQVVFISLMCEYFQACERGHLVGETLVLEGEYILGLMMSCGEECIRLFLFQIYAHLFSHFILSGVIGWKWHAASAELPGGL